MLPRLLLALGSLGVLVWATRRGLHIGSFGGAAAYGAAGYFILALAMLISVVILTAPEVVLRIGEAAYRILTTLIFPDARFDKPKLCYILPRLYALQMRYAEAIAEYQKILRHYPDEKSAYRELLEVCQVSGQSVLAQKIQTAFLKRFPHEPLGETGAPPLRTRPKSASSLRS